ncbi:MAG: DUF2062 domain-containing protein [Gammaproteobacteria bacterium]|nr:DUF2062 domain-containing protein [Gammaproteobacteria bacterium]
MPKNWFKRYLPTPEQVRNHASLQWLGTLLHDPNLWHINRRSLPGGVAVGLFFAFVPIPFQMLPAALFAILLRVNLPIAIAGVWLTNPLTTAPLFYLAYKVGASLLSIPAQAFNFQLSPDWLFLELRHRWRPFLLGCFVMACGSAFLGFFTVRALWHLHILQRLKDRKLLQRIRIRLRANRKKANLKQP